MLEWSQDGVNRQRTSTPKSVTSYSLVYVFGSEGGANWYLYSQHGLVGRFHHERQAKAEAELTANRECEMVRQREELMRKFPHMYGVK